MSWQKHTFLWIIFCATRQITGLKMMIVGHYLSVYSGDTGCPAIQLTCQPRKYISKKNFCIMNVKQEASSIGNYIESGETFHFSITNRGSEYEVMMYETMRDVTMLFMPDQPQYLPSKVYQNLSGYSLNCLRDLGGLLNVNEYLLDPQETCDVAAYNHSACEGKKGSKYVLQVNGTQTTCVTCIKPPATINSSKASEMMDDLQNIATRMGQNYQSIKPINMEGVKGLVHRQDRNTEPKDVIIFSSSDQDEITVTDPQNITQIQYSWFVKISAEAFKRSRQKNNGSAFVGVLQFKNMDVNDKAQNLIVLNNEIYGISMGANISNLNDNIEIFIRVKNLVGNVSCNSWDGRGNLTWTTFGCVTELNTTIIKCSCSHLTFFAVLGTKPNYVNSIPLTLIYGFILAIVLLFICLYMCVLFRKNRPNRSTMIAMETQVCRSSCK